MSIVRWSDESDVYVYNSSNGLVCCDCDIAGGDFTTRSHQEMIDHIGCHVTSGHKVPEYVIESIKIFEFDNCAMNSMIKCPNCNTEITKSEFWSCELCSAIDHAGCHDGRVYHARVNDKTITLCLSCLQAKLKFERGMLANDEQ